MIVILAETAANFIATAEDFKRLNNSAHNYVVEPINMSSGPRENFSGVTLDCMNYTIYSSVEFLDVVSWSTIENCVFMLETTFANEVTNLEAINVTFIHTAETIQPMITGQIANSLLLGVRMQVNDPLAKHSDGNRYIGIYVTNELDEDKDLAGLAYNSISDVVVHCSFHTNFVARTANNVGGLFCSSDTLVISNTTVFTAIKQEISNKTYIGGISSSGMKIELYDVDIVMNILLGEMDGYVGGLLGVLMQGSAEIQRVSAAVEMTLVTSRASSNLFAIGGVVGRCLEGNETLKEITVYATMNVNSTQEQRCLVGGALGDVEEGRSASIQDIYVFGEFNFDAFENFVFGGIIGEFDEGELRQSVFNGKIFAIPGTNSSIAGVVALLMQTAMVYKCEAHGTVASYPYITGPGEFFMGGLVGLSNYGNLNLSYSNEEVVLNDDLISPSTDFFIGMLVGNANNTAAIENCFATGILKCTLLESQSVYGCMAVIAGECDFCSITGAFSMVDLKIEAVSGAPEYVGTIIGRASYAEVEDVFIRGRINVYSVITCGSIVGYAIGFSEFNRIAIMIEADTGSALPYVGREENCSGFDRNTIAIDCYLGNHLYDPNLCVTSEEMKSKDILSRIGPNFILSEGDNNGYPYLRNLPIPQYHGFKLAAEGFDNRSFYIDDSLLPFLKINFSLCEGACYGNYISPLEYTCTFNSSNTTEFCVDNSEAEKKFPNDSCMQSNAYCTDGVSGCNSDSELVDFECKKNCTSCEYGYCKFGFCACIPYYSDMTCSTPDCNAFKPVCFGKPHTVCSATDECVCEDSQYYQTEDGCFLGCPGLFPSHGSCIADGVAECINHWVSVNGGFCNQCDEGYELRNETCIDIGSLCYEGRCVHGNCVEEPSVTCQCYGEWTSTRCDECRGYGQDCDMSQSECDILCNRNGICTTYQTDICSCHTNYAGRHCDECAPGYFLQSCMSPAQCGSIECSSHGQCQGSATQPTCKCANLWQGSTCETCKDYGSNCDENATECRDELCDKCADKSHCRCAGSQYSPRCECLPGWFTEDCGLSQDQCDAQRCGGHGRCGGGIAHYCTCAGFWIGDSCGTCQGYGPGCNMSKQTCQEALCDNGGACEGFGAESRCVCFEHYDFLTNCSACVSGYIKDGLDCVKKSVGVWPIVGGVCGGLALLALILGVIYYFVRRHRLSVAYAKIGASPGASGVNKAGKAKKDKKSTAEEAEI